MSIPQNSNFGRTYFILKQQDKTHKFREVTKGVGIILISRVNSVSKSSERSGQSLTIPTKSESDFSIN